MASFAGSDPRCLGRLQGRHVLLRKKGRPSPPDGRDGLHRSFVHIADQLFSGSGSVKRGAVAENSELKVWCEATDRRRTWGHGL